MFMICFTFSCEQEQSVWTEKGGLHLAEGPENCHKMSKHKLKLNGVPRSENSLALTKHRLTYKQAYIELRVLLFLFFSIAVLTK